MAGRGITERSSSKRDACRIIASFFFLGVRRANERLFLCRNPLCGHRPGCVRRILPFLCPPLHLFELIFTTSRKPPSVLGLDLLALRDNPHPAGTLVRRALPRRR